MILMQTSIVKIKVNMCSNSALIPASRENFGFVSYIFLSYGNYKLLPLEGDFILFWLIVFSKLLTVKLGLEIGAFCSSLHFSLTSVAHTDGVTHQ